MFFGNTEANWVVREWLGVSGPDLQLLVFLLGFGGVGEHLIVEAEMVHGGLGFELGESGYAEELAMEWTAFVFDDKPGADLVDHGRLISRVEGMPRGSGRCCH